VSAGRLLLPLIIMRQPKFVSSATGSDANGYQYVRLAHCFAMVLEKLKATRLETPFFESFEQPEPRQ
jgi:hypothetical protein